MCKRSKHVLWWIPNGSAFSVSDLGDEYGWCTGGGDGMEDDEAAAGEGSDLDCDGEGGKREICG